MPYKDARLGVNARILTGGQSVSQKVSAPLLCNVKPKLQKALRSMLLYLKFLLLGMDMVICANILFLRSEVQGPTVSQFTRIFI